MKDKILGVLYGMAIGDAMGMPPELWTRKRLLKEYGEIKDFLDGHPENEISYQYKKGNFTDDTAQALTIIDSLIETDFVPNSENIAKHILNWAKKENAFENNILGPTSKITLSMFQEGKDPKEFSDKAVTNGSAMRIAPIGTLFSSNQKKELCDYVFQISKVTHSSDITIASACMIAMAISSVLDNKNKEEMIEDVLSIEDYAMSLGAETISALLSTRIKYCIDLAIKYKNDSNKFLENLYNMTGATVNAIDSIPCAIALAYYTFDVKDCALMCANLGGDTDTIGAMATAICGGVNGTKYIPKDYIDIILNANNTDFNKYSDALTKRRGTL